MLKSQLIFNSKFKYPLLLFLIFIIGRMVIYFGYESYISDTYYYSEIARQGLVLNFKCYEDFSFGYPPLALLFVYIPHYLSLFFDFSYTRCFQFQMLLLDIGLFVWILYFLFEKIRVNIKSTITFVGLYICFGFLQGHLIYDRLDLLTSLSLFMLLYAFVCLKRSRSIIRYLSLFGLFIKLVPVIYSLFLNLILKFFESKLEKTTLSRLKQLIKWGLLETLALLTPFLLLVVLYQNTIAPGVFKDMDMHRQRGIQVESTWAAPILLLQVFDPASTSIFENNFGALHLNDTRVPNWYLLASKVFGLIALSIYGLLFYIYVIPKIKKEPKNQALYFYLGVLVWINLFGIFLSSQRVLSPQFFIWLMIPLALIQTIKLDPWMMVLSITLYLLTYISFDIGYVGLISLNPTFVVTLVIRNIILIGITILSLFRLLQINKSRI